MKVRYMGHSCFEITTDKLKILTDPYYYSLSSGNQREVSPIKPELVYDYILISHEHFDHCDSQLIDEIFSEKTKIITTPEAAATLSHPCHTISTGQVYEDKNIKIEAVRADHPQSKNPIGFYFYLPEQIYFAGDTYHYPEMGDISPPFLAFIPIGGEYTSDIETGSDIAALVCPQHIIPMHYNTWAVIKADTGEFVREIKSKTMAAKVHVLDPGQAVDLSAPKGSVKPPVF